MQKSFVALQIAPVRSHGYAGSRATSVRLSSGKNALCVLKRAGATAAAVLAFVLPAWGYEGGPTGNWGSIRGRVTVTGHVPTDETIEVTNDRQHCGDTLPREKYVIGAGGGVRWVVVFLDGIKKGKPVFAEDVQIAIKHCAFQPHVQVGVLGQTVVVKNEDHTAHTSGLEVNSLTIFNSALPRPGMAVKKRISETGPGDIWCEEHLFMHGFLFAADNPYITVTDAEGRYLLTDVPPGSYKLKLWHEALGWLEKAVTVSPGTTVEASMEFAK